MQKLMMVVIFSLVVINVGAQNTRHDVPITFHVNFGPDLISIGDRVFIFSAQLGYRISKPIVVGSSIGIKHEIILNNLERGKYIKDNEKFNFGGNATCFVGFQPGYLMNPIVKNRENDLYPFLGFRLEAHFGYQMDQFSARPISFVRVGLNLLPIFVGVFLDYYLINKTPNPIEGWYIKDNSRFLLSITIVSVQ